MSQDSPTLSWRCPRTLVTIPRLGLNELADSPLQKVGFLYGQSITVDANATGTDANGNTWVGTPVANVSGYIQQVSTQD